MNLRPLLLALFALCLTACSAGPAPDEDGAPGAKDRTTTAEDGKATVEDTMTDSETATEIATLGAGCFWCVEAVLEQLEGVLDVRSGYMGGRVEDPSYKAVCTGTTGHAEVVEVTFDPKIVTYDQVLEWFWQLHDPTTLNRQGADVGTQYRSAIFYHSEAQREAAERSKAAADASGEFPGPIVTEITEASTFWPAEGYHQDYYRENPSQGYCRAVIAPKLKKLGLKH